MTDTLDGFRSNALLMGAKIAKPSENGELFQRMYLGDIALSIMQGIGTNESARELVANLIAYSEQEVQQLAAQLVKLDTLDTDEARHLHFEARVSAAILGRINQFVRDGHHAAMLLGDKGET